MQEINIPVEEPLDHEIDCEIVVESSGTSDYNDLENKPSINGVELKGKLTTSDLGIEVDTSNLITKDELESKGYLTEHQDISHLASKEELSEKQDKGDFALKSEIPNVPTKLSELENDSGFITDVSEALKGGEYIDVAKGKAETLYEYKSVFDETNIGMTTSNNVTCFTNNFDYIIGSLAEMSQVDNPVGELYMVKLTDEQIKHIVPLLKADKTPYTLLECMNDGFFTAFGATDLSREGKIVILDSMTGGNVDPDTNVYAIQVVSDSPFFSSFLMSVYQDKFGNYIAGIYIGWHVTPINEIAMGEANYLVVDFNDKAKELINGIKNQIGDIETALSEV